MADSGDHSIPTSELMLTQLQGLLQQLEAASGTPDAEARQALERLHASLNALEAARAGNLDAVSASGDDAKPIPQRMETLQGRVAVLESRLEGMSPGAQEIISGSAGAWVQGQITAAGEQGNDGEAAAAGGESGGGESGGLQGQK